MLTGLSQVINFIGGSYKDRTCDPLIKSYLQDQPSKTQDDLGATNNEELDSE